MKTVWFNVEGIRGDGRIGSIYERLGGRSWWVVRWSLAAAAVVFVVPFAMVAMAALLTFALVFTVLGLIDRVVRWGRTQFGGAEGRRNVTVVRVDDGG